MTGPVPTELEQRAARHELFLHLGADEETESRPEEGWLEPCPAVGPSPNLRCDKEVLLAVRDRLRGEHRELLHTWHRDNHIEYFQGVGVSIGDGVADVGWLALDWLVVRSRVSTGWITAPGVEPAAGFGIYHAARKRVAGPDSPEWGQLTRLQVLDLAGNALTGAVPPALGRLAHVERLDLSGNRLTGPLPAELGTLGQLQELNLSHNRLTGPLPAELGQLGQLGVLALAGNALTGAIPTELGQLRNLQELHLQANKLTGAIPAEMGQIWWLGELRLGHNRLTGSIPEELRQLTHLDMLDLGHNRLTGSIPSFLGQLLGLKELYLHANEFTGPIPAELGQLGRLRRLNVSHNRLTGPIPTELEQRVARHELSLHLGADEAARNQTEGEPEPCPETGPSPSLRCDKEVLLAVRDTLWNERWDRIQTWQPDMGIENFAGVLLGDEPRRVVGLEIVGERPTSSPAFHMGYVPWQLSRLPRLERLVLRGNGMFGTIPPELGQLPRLRTLDLSGNWLRGAIPAELGQLRELRELQLQDNPFLTGCIPPALAPACDCPDRLCE